MIYSALHNLIRMFLLLLRAMNSNVINVSALNETAVWFETSGFAGVCMQFIKNSIRFRITAA